MAHGGVNIESPEVIQQFRNHFVLFDKACQQAVSGLKTDIQRTKDWLQREQLQHWKRELRKREEAYQTARRECHRARLQAQRSSESAYIEAKKVLDRATRRKEEAEQKIRSLKKWSGFLDHKVGELIGPCLNLSNQLESFTPRALARLDRMVESLEEYFRTVVPESGGSTHSEE